jgi:undecaprenyl-diphosphatase
MFRDMERAEAARFSFLLGFPLILAASLTGLSDVMRANDVSTGNIMLGIAFSAISGLFAISWLIAILKRMPTTIFTIYRIAAGAAIVLLIATGVR